MQIIQKVKLIWKTVTAFERKMLLFFIILIPISTAIELLHLISIVPLVNGLGGDQGNTTNFMISSENLSILAVCAIFGAVSVLSAITRYIHNMLLHKSTYGVLKQVSNAMYQARILGSFSRTYDQKSSDVFNLFSNKLLYLAAHFLGPVLAILHGVFLVVMIVTMLLVQLKVIFIILIVFVVAVYGVYISLSKKITIKNSRAISLDTARHVALVVQLSDYLKEIKLFGIEQENINKFFNVEKTLRSSQVSVQIIAHGSKFIVEAVALVGIALAIIVASAWNDPSIIAKLALLVFSTQKLLPAIQNLFSNYSLILSGKDMVAEIFQEIEVAESIPLKSTSKRPAPRGDRQITRVCCKELKFSYPNSPELQFDEIDFEIGGLNCIVGRSGSGKSSLTNLLSNLFNPNSGDIRYFAHDNPIPTDEVSFSYCSQQPVIFDATVEENLINKPANFHTISKVVDIDFVSTGHRIHSKNLSGGERQRIGIARAINVKSDVYIFDEPTAALDEHNVRKFILGIIEFSKKNLVIIVTHDDRLIVKAERLINLS